jgi:hypothetical protein
MASGLRLLTSEGSRVGKNQLLRRRQIMKGKYLLRRIGGSVLAASLLFGVAIMSSRDVQAQRGGGFHGGAGFHSGGGFHGGFHDRGFHDRGFNDRGFHGGFHTRVFIGPGFGWGYPYGYYGYPYGYSSQYVFGDSVAADNQGYQDGLETGSSDARRGQSYDPERSHYFKDAGFGNFAEDYREGFTRGYSDGFHS